MAAIALLGAGGKIGYRPVSNLNESSHALRDWLGWLNPAWKSRRADLREAGTIK